ncbi:MAG: TIGR04086 family membrane protein [Clostridia bacterium]|nr:TIGR04086 family membrane protein [Clostridia bacterium]
MSSNKLIKPLAFGLIVSIIVTFIFLALSAIASTNLDLNDTANLVLSLISANFGVAVGGFVAGKLNKSKGYLVGALNGIISFIILTIISFFFSQESMTAISLIKLITFVLSSIIGGILGVNFNKKRNF